MLRTNNFLIFSYNINKNKPVSCATKLYYLFYINIYNEIYIYY